MLKGPLNFVFLSMTHLVLSIVRITTEYNVAAIFAANSPTFDFRIDRDHYITTTYLFLSEEKICVPNSYANSSLSEAPDICRIIKTTSI